MKAHTILFVKDQQKSTKFYSEVLKLNPILNVPGMTEFQLSESLILGLMPVEGAKKILGTPFFSSTTNAPSSELYLRLENFEDYFSRALENGAKEISPILKRNWGDTAGYISDPDNHIIAFSSLK